MKAVWIPYLFYVYLQRRVPLAWWHNRQRAPWRAGVWVSIHQHVWYWGERLDGRL